MIKKMICIECPKGCALSIDVESMHVKSVTGNECPKGKKYAIQEIESPMRVVTSVMLAKGLSLKMVPVRTNKPIPKSKIMEAMNEIKKICIEKPIKTGDIIVENFLDLNVDLIATRQAFVVKEPSLDL